MDTNLPLRSGISDLEWEARIDLAAAFRLVDVHGWSDFLATHLSTRVPNTDDQFFFNPFGMLFEEITASSLIKIDGDGNILSESDSGFNPAGFVIHSAVHTARNDAMWVLPLRKKVCFHLPNMPSPLSPTPVITIMRASP